MVEDRSAPLSSNQLPRVLGRLEAYCIVVGSIIGSGIFLKPTTIAGALGDFRWILFVWLAVGVVVLFGALAIAELSAMMPRAGGPYVYLRAAYGRAPAFLWGWTEFWIIRTASVGALSAACVAYLSVLVDMDLNAQEVATMAIIVGLATVNFVSTRWGASVQNTTVFLKMGFLALVVLLPFLKGEANVGNLSTTIDVDHSIWQGLGVAMLAVWWAYDGWINICPVAEEIRDPQRNVPLALLFGVATVIGLYILATIAYHCALPMNEVAGSKAVASDVFKKLLGSDVGAKIVAAGVAFSTFGAANSSLIVGPRILFAMARDGLVPSALKHVHARFQTPGNAVAVQAVWTLVLVHAAFEFTRLNPDRVTLRDVFNRLTNFCVLGETIFYSMVVAAVFVLRRKLPNLARPYRAWGYPVAPAICLSAFVALLASLWTENQLESLAGFGIILIGAAYYAWAVRRPEAQATAAE